LPERPWSAKDLLDVHDGNLLTKGLAVYAVAIMQQILGAVSKGKAVSAVGPESWRMGYEAAFTLRLECYLP
jgi:hypothetical protein